MGHSLRTHTTPTVPVVVSHIDWSVTFPAKAAPVHRACAGGLSFMTQLCGVIKLELKQQWYATAFLREAVVEEGGSPYPGSGE